MSRLDDFLRARRADIEAALDAYLPAAPTCPTPVADAMRYSVKAGGKRLRPVLVLAAAETVAAHRREPADAARALALPAACAIEMIHTYSLIHDDLPAMDDDTMRRGRPTCHVVHGEGMAILAGDGLHAEAFGLLAREPRTDEPHLVARKLQAIAIVATAAGAAGMVGGQAIDLDAARPDRTGPPLDAAGIDEMHARKTGALIRASAVTGAVMAGADAAMIGRIDDYAAACGLAFQIVDDILDVEGQSQALGKTAGKDAAAGKPTYVALYGVAKSREMADGCLARAEQALAEAGIADSLLADIGRWIVRRST